MDSSGNVFVADSYNNRIQKFTSSGSFITAWGSFGSGPGQFNNPPGAAVDSIGNVFVADNFNNRVQKFTADGQFITAWGNAGSEQGEFIELQGIGVDGLGDVYVADTFNHRIQKFSNDGLIKTIIGGYGFGAGLFNTPYGVTVDQDGNVLVLDTNNNRIQKFRPVTISAVAKAVVVAGRRAVNDSLWDATQVCANFAHRTLTHQGFTKETIRYLSSDTQLDLDSNGLPDDVFGPSTKANLQTVLTEWASTPVEGLPVDDLVVYMVDHGGPGTFSLNAAEILTEQELAAWLDEAQSGVSGTVTVVIESCYSGSLLNALASPGRIVITSTDPDELAYLTGTGTVSFSGFFWTDIFSGSNVFDAYEFASLATTLAPGEQTPQMNDSASGALAASTHIGHGTLVSADVPQIGDVSDPQAINGTTSALLVADPVTDPDGIARVWAVIRPPDYVPPANNNPILDLPTLELTPASQDSQHWSGTYDGFVTEGIYAVAIYARDRQGNVSPPELTSVTVGNPAVRKAIIVAGGAVTDPGWPAVQKLTRLAYDSLRKQGYAADTIQLLSPDNFVGVYAPNTKANLENAIVNWAPANGQALAVTLVGDGTEFTYFINNSETVTAAELDSWLDTAQNTLPGKTVISLELPNSGEFISALVPPPGKQRIVLACAGPDDIGQVLSEGDISFSNFFWRQVLNGVTVEKAFRHAALAVEFTADGQVAQIEDNGNGIPNEKADGQIARTYVLGSGVLLAGNDPIVGSIDGPISINGSLSTTIRANSVTSTTDIERVWAIVTPPALGTKSLPIVAEVDFVAVGDDAFEANPQIFTDPGVYEIAVFAKDIHGNVSLPATTTVTQQSASVLADAYEDDDTPQTASFIGLDADNQVHNFHDSGDEDWAQFYVPGPESVRIDTVNVGLSADTMISVLKSDGITLLDSVDDVGVGQEEILIFNAPEAGMYFAQVKDFDPNTSGEGTQYTLRVFRESGPEPPGSVVGTVRDAITDEPISGAAIRLAGAGSGTATVLTAPDGVYLYAGLPAGTYTLDASAGSLYEASLPQVVVISSGEIEPVDFWLAPSTISVPNVVGLTEAAAESAITGVGLTVGTVAQAHSSTVPTGQVISQSPSAGTQVLPGSAVDFVVSLGPAPVSVPNVVGMTQAAAESAIAGAGLAVGTVTQAHSSTVPAGQVISQQPVAGTQVLPSSAVDFVVSLGPAPVSVPNVVGMTQAAAESAITGAGLAVGTVTPAHSDTVPAGQVISQEPNSGSQVLPGNAVDMVVSLGPAPISVPNVVGLTQAAAENTIIGAGLTVGTVTPVHSGTVPAGQVISQSPDAGQMVAMGSAVNLVVSIGQLTDPNGDGEIDAVDVQLVINAALGISTGFDCDMDGDGDVDAIDVQLIINAALGL